MQTSLSKAIELAKENGWEQKLPKFVLNTTVIENPDLLDPLFFQALGKSLGWRDNNDGVVELAGWYQGWHEFIDHLAEGKSADEFFNNLLK